MNTTAQTQHKLGFGPERNSGQVRLEGYRGAISNTQRLKFPARGKLVSPLVKGFFVGDKLGRKVIESPEIVAFAYLFLVVSGSNTRTKSASVLPVQKCWLGEETIGSRQGKQARVWDTFVTARTRGLIVGPKTAMASQWEVVTTRKSKEVSRWRTSRLLEGGEWSGSGRPSVEVERAIATQDWRVTN